MFRRRVPCAVVRPRPVPSSAAWPYTPVNIYSGSRHPQHVAIFMEISKNLSRLLLAVARCALSSSIAGDGTSSKAPRSGAVLVSILYGLPHHHHARAVSVDIPGGLRMA